MQIKTTDFINRKGQIWLSENFLLQHTTGLSDQYMRTAARPRYKESVRPCELEKDFLPDTGKAWRWAKTTNGFYYCYDNIPDKAPAMFRSQLPSRTELNELLKEVQKEGAATKLQVFIKAHSEAHFTDYLHCFGDCSPKQQKSLALACSLIEATVTYIRENCYDLKKNNLFIELSDLFQKEDYNYIPHNYRCLKNKVVSILKENKAITDIIYLPRSENKNAAKYNDAEVESWVLQLRQMGRNYTNTHIIRKIKEMCVLSEKPAPSDRWIGTIMEKHRTNFLTAAERFGDKSSWGNIYKGYIPMANALYAGDCWQIDATRFNIIAHKAVADRVGEEKAKRPQYLFIITVRDVHSGDILGYDFDYAENRWAYVNALAMAVKESGYLPYQMIFDKFPGHNTEEFKNLVTDLEARKVRVTFSVKTTGKQRLERHFGTLQTVFMQESDYYYGQGIKSRRRYAHRSEQYLASARKKAAKEGFDYEAAVNEASVIVERYRNTSLNQYSRKYGNIEKSPRQLHMDSEKPNVVLIEPKIYSYLFGLKKVLPIKNGGLIITEIHKTEFIYRVTDYNLISNYSEVLVAYDLEDLSFCHLYENTTSPLKKHLGVAAEEIRAQGFGPNAQWGEVTKRQAIIAQIELARLEDVSVRKAVGDDILTLLTPGYSNKDDYSNAESSYLETQVLRVANSMKDMPGSGNFESDIRDEY